MHCKITNCSTKVLRKKICERSTLELCTHHGVSLLERSVNDCTKNQSKNCTLPQHK